VESRGSWGWVKKLPGPTTKLGVPLAHQQVPGVQMQNIVSREPGGGGPGVRSRPGGSGRTPRNQEFRPKGPGGAGKDSPSKPQGPCTGTPGFPPSDWVPPAKDGGFLKNRKGPPHQVSVEAKAFPALPLPASRTGLSPGARPRRADRGNLIFELLLLPPPFDGWSGWGGLALGPSGSIGVAGAPPRIGGPLAEKKPWPDSALGGPVRFPQPSQGPRPG